MVPNVHLNLRSHRVQALGRGSDIDSRFRLLADYLRRWCHGDTSPEVITYLLVVAADFARQYSGRRLSAAARHEEVGIEQMARSVAAVVFLRSGPRSPLCEALGPYLDSDAKLIARFLSYTTTAINNELFARWRTSDPSGFNLRECLKDALKNGQYVCWPPHSHVWVCMAGIDNLQVGGVPFSEPELTQLACETACSSDPDVPKWLFKIMTILSGESGRQKFVEIEALFQGMRLAVGILLESNSTEENRAEFLDPATRKQLADEIDSACAKSHQYIDRYAVRHNLGEIEQESLHKALNAYIEDVKAHGRPRLSQREYVKEQWPQMTDGYYKQYLKSPFQDAIAYFWQQLRKNFD